MPWISQKSTRTKVQQKMYYHNFWKFSTYFSNVPYSSNVVSVEVFRLQMAMESCTTAKSSNFEVGTHFPLGPFWIVLLAIADEAAWIKKIKVTCNSHGTNYKPLHVTFTCFGNRWLQTEYQKIIFYFRFPISSFWRILPIPFIHGIGIVDLEQTLPQR